MNDYTYSKGMITRIAKAYSEIYAGIPELKPHDYVRDEVMEYILYKVITKEPVTYREIAELLKRSSDITDMFLVAEYKADYDNALRQIGRGNWQGNLDPVFRNYKYYGRLQRIILATMLEIEDSQLEVWGFEDVPRLRGTALSRMMEVLNG